MIPNETGRVFLWRGEQQMKIQLLWSPLFADQMAREECTSICRFPGHTGREEKFRRLKGMDPVNSWIKTKTTATTR